MSNKKSKPPHGGRERTTGRYRKMEKLGAKLTPTDTPVGGDPPGGDSLERRIEALEKVMPEMRERLAKIEATVQSIQVHGATKADLSNLESTMIKWYVGTSFTMVGLVAAITFAAARILAS